jgi:hypothetical protein
MLYNIPKRGLNHDCKVIQFQGPLKLPFESLPIVNRGVDKIINGLALDGDIELAPVRSRDGVIAGFQGRPFCLMPKSQGSLLPRVYQDYTLVQIFGFSLV